MAEEIVEPVPGTDYLEEYDRKGTLLSRTPLVHTAAEDARIADIQTIKEALATADASLTTTTLARALKAIARTVS